MAITKAVRKKKIDKDRHAWSRIVGWVPYYDNLHQYSKNKVHCSCRMCRGKDYFGRHILTRQEQKSNDDILDQIEYYNFSLNDC